MKLTIFDPHTNEISILKNGGFVPYQTINKSIEKIDDFEKLIESTHRNLAVYKIK